MTIVAFGKVVSTVNQAELFGTRRSVDGLQDQSRRTRLRGSWRDLETDKYGVQIDGEACERQIAGFLIPATLPHMKKPRPDGRGWFSGEAVGRDVKLAARDSGYGT